jgi:hypothetical protein
LFKPNDEVINKYTKERAIVSYLNDEEIMTVRFRNKKFTKGNLEGFYTQVLIKNFELYQSIKEKLT